MAGVPSGIDSSQPQVQVSHQASPPAEQAAAPVADAAPGDTVQAVGGAATAAMPPQVQNIRIVTADGSVTAPLEQQQQIRIVNADGTVSTLGNVRPSPVQQQSQKQIRIVKLEPGVQQQPQQQQQQQQIRVVNADGSLSTLAAGSVRVLSSSSQGNVFLTICSLPSNVADGFL